MVSDILDDFFSAAGDLPDIAPMGDDALQDDFSSNPFFAGRMEKKILVIGNKREFLTGSIVSKLKEQKFTVDICEPSVKDVTDRIADMRLCLVMIEYVSLITDLLVYLQDQAYDRHIHVCVICNKTDESELTRYLPMDEITAIFYRPVNVKEIGVRMTDIFEATKWDEKKKTILLIDDDITFLQRTKDVLKAEYKTYIANTGASAIKIMMMHPIDLILLDYEMPVIDGPHVYRMIKGEPELSSIPIMFLTGKTDTESVVEAVKLKPEKYITKAMNADELLSTIREFFVIRRRSQS